MRNIWAITTKELRVYLTTWTAYVVLVAFFEITAFFFYFLLRDYQTRRLQYLEAKAVAYLDMMNLTDMVVGPLFSYIASFFVFLLPVLTMRLFAAERRQKTIELLLTVPVRPLEVVLGKFFAATGVMLLMLGCTLVFPITLHFIADAAGPSAVDWGTVSTGYLGMALLGAGGVAVGLLASALTESQVIAAVIGFSVLLALTVAGIAAPEGSAGWQGVLRALSLAQHFEGFTRGLVRLTDVTYYTSMIFLGVFLSHRVVESYRWR